MFTKFIVKIYIDGSTNLTPTSPPPIQKILVYNFSMISNPNPE